MRSAKSLCEILTRTLQEVKITRWLQSWRCKRYKQYVSKQNPAMLKRLMHFNQETSSPRKQDWFHNCPKMEQLTHYINKIKANCHIVLSVQKKHLTEVISILWFKNFIANLKIETFLILYRISIFKIRTETILRG